MVYQIQPNIFCENCINCGKRPVIAQIKSGWAVKCPDENCNNMVVNKIVDLDAWNKLNKPIQTISDSPLKKII
jgi:hypothetical protein